MQYLDQARIFVSATDVGPFGTLGLGRTWGSTVSVIRTLARLYGGMPCLKSFGNLYLSLYTYMYLTRIPTTHLNKKPMTAITKLVKPRRLGCSKFGPCWVLGPGFMWAVSGLRKCYKGCVGMHRVHRAQGLGWLWGSKHDRV